MPVLKNARSILFLCASLSLLRLLRALFALVILIEGVNSLSLFSPCFAFTVATFSLDKEFDIGAIYMLKEMKALEKKNEVTIVLIAVLLLRHHRMDSTSL